MRKFSLTFVKKLLHDQSGQTLFWAVGGMLAMVGVAGLTLDVGHAYVVHGQLQNSANAAALAAAGEVYNSNTTTNATAYANAYSASASEKNQYANLGTVTTTVTTVCLNSLLVNATCTTGSPANAVKVTNTVAVSTWFMRIFGVNTINVGATATSTMQGVAQPWNVAIIVDATQSMSNSDSNCGGLTEFQCALSGVQTLLAATHPCGGGLTGSSCTPSVANFRVSLFSFPNLSTAKFSDDSPCGTGSVFTNEPYTLPTTTATTYTPLTYTGSTAYSATYQIVDWDSSYYDPTSITTGGLSTSDNLVKAIGYNANPKTGAVGTKGCLPNVGGESTYYASVIYAAQAALRQEQAAMTAAGKTTQNALILLSDGQAQADSSKFPQKTSTASTGGLSVTSAGTTTYKSGATNLTGGTWGTYPDYNNECQQAIAAAQAATAAGTVVYSVAYGSEDSGCTSSGGGTDSTLVLTNQTSFNAPFTLAQLTPCVTMENIATSLQYFFSDYNQSGSGSTCQDNSHTVVALQDIFLAISSNFTTPRLISNSAT
jgi:hypothetical protein